MISPYRPEFQSTSYSGSVAEDARTQTRVLTVLATDQDSGDNGKVTYSLLGTDLPFAVKVCSLLIVLGTESPDLVLLSNLESSCNRF